MLRLCCIGCRNFLIAICLTMLCADFASSQAPGNPSEQPQARVKALYAEGMSALRKQDLAGAQATFEKLIRSEIFEDKIVTAVGSYNATAPLNGSHSYLMQ